MSTAIQYHIHNGDDDGGQGISVDDDGAGGRGLERVYRTEYSTLSIPRGHFPDRTHRCIYIYKDIYGVYFVGMKSH